MDYMSGLPSTEHGNDCVFVVVDRFSKMTILTTSKKNIMVEAMAKLFFKRVWVHLGSHRQSFFIGIANSSVHFGPTCGHYWTPSSPNPLHSIPKPMARQRWSIRWSCTSYRCITPNIHGHGMTSFLLSNTTTTKLFIALLAITHSR